MSTTAITTICAPTGTTRLLQCLPPRAAQNQGPGTRPQLSSRDPARQTLPATPTDLASLPLELQEAIREKLDERSVHALGLVSRTFAMEIADAGRATRLRRRISDQVLAAHLSDLKGLWKEYQELPFHHRRGVTISLIKKTYLMLIRDRRAESTKTSDAHITIDREIAEQAISQNLADKCFHNSWVFLWMITFSQQILHGDIGCFREFFQNLPVRTRAEIFAVLKFGRSIRLITQNLASGLLPVITLWCAEVINDALFRKSVSQHSVLLMRNFPLITFTDTKWAEEFLSFTIHNPAKTMLDFQMLSQYMEKLSLLDLPFDKFMLNVKFLLQQCSKLPADLGASLRYLIRMVCNCMKSRLGNMEFLMFRWDTICISVLENEASPAQKRVILRSFFRTAIANEKILQWVSMYRELPVSERFSLLWSLPRSTFDGFQTNIFSILHSARTQMFEAFSDDLYAKLFQKMAEWHYSASGDPMVLSLSEDALLRLKTFSPVNKQLALCNLATMIINASDRQAETHAQHFLSLASGLPVELKAKVALAILKAQQARLRDTPTFSFQKIAWLAQDLPEESAEALRQELRAYQALLVKQTSAASIENG